ncbi:hypothetical protein KDK95_33050 [Actinospica sp. MGRD01-02]|uniref:Uncharacterized protein n=1 Tax=Actinospica acidithermotolerans TaxID=2828514 RepID=A0A941EGT0_9ACTN|nr:hypothetical protein [Actinospica acidithermotolerans]MBR7831181.1 hypothetical protein [Actinospica acidithermotolerans]
MTTQPEESPAETPNSAPAEPTQPIVPAQPAEPTQQLQPPAPATGSGPLVPPPPAPLVAPAPAPAPAWGQQAPVDPALQGVASVGAVPGVAVLSPEEQAAVEAKKAKRRMLFAKTAVLAVPAIALVGLLIGTSVESSALTNKTNTASTAAKAANAAAGLVAQLRAAQSAAEASILVDPGCVAVESKATATLETKVVTDTDALLKAEQGSSFAAVDAAANAYINDLQTFSTNLQQDAALSSRSNLKTSVGSVTSDLGVLISAMQTAISGNYTTATDNSFQAAADRMVGDETAVDTLCGGTTLVDGNSSSSSSGNSTTSA